jgi:hypothetical protein
MQKVYRFRVKEFVIKIIKTREHLLRNNLGYVNSTRFIAELGEIRNKIAFYETDAQCKAFLRNNYDMLYMIIPGEGSACHEKLHKDLEALMNEELTINN